MDRLTYKGNKNIEFYSFLESSTSECKDDNANLVQKISQSHCKSFSTIIKSPKDSIVQGSLSGKDDTYEETNMK